MLEDNVMEIWNGSQRFEDEYQETKVMFGVTR